ncbi:hypothetical protein TWF225_000458 [Orbilia oligospora]|nr:hypothetical protein TWF225_000458 [Orbilia oligospora]KAF3237822.1 hypothetical protein TWF128_000811 [Orbilia oligospora]
MSGRILIYDRGEYSTSPGRLSANYLAPTMVHTSMTIPTVVAELELHFTGLRKYKKEGANKSETSELETLPSVYASKDSEVEYINGWEFICCSDRPSTLWNYYTAKKYRDEGGQNSELTGILKRRDDQLDDCTPQTLSFEKLDGETAADDIIYADVLKREVYAEAKDTNVKNT